MLLEGINKHLQEKGLLVSKGSMVDATILHTPSFTRNADKKRDPEMHQTKKGNQWYFGMKIHVGADVTSGGVHSVTVTAANGAGETSIYCEESWLLEGQVHSRFANMGGY